MNKPLLVLHSPSDKSVAIDEARRIFDAVRHPKSFVSLDNADHLLTRREDAEYAADVIGAWSRRYVTTRPDHEPTDTGVSVSEGADKYLQIIQAGQHVLEADEPKSIGGGDRGPSPYELLLAALGTCTSMTLRMYADRKGWPLEHTRVRLSHSKIHAKDCENCDTKLGYVDRIERVIELDGRLDDQQRARLLEIADRCPVHRTLTSEVSIVTRES